LNNVGLLNSVGTVKMMGTFGMHYDMDMNLLGDRG
jgi:hypothetical protein